MLALIEPPNYILFPLWFLVGIAGLVNAIVLLVKKELVPVTAIMFVLSLIIIAIGGLMRLFLTM